MGSKQQFRRRTTNVINTDTVTDNWSLNLPSYQTKDGRKYGIPLTLGATIGNKGGGINASIGIDIGKVNVNVSISLTLGWDNWLAADTKLNAGYDKHSVGLEAAVGLSPYSNAKIGIHHTIVEEDTTVMQKMGVYARTGYVYAVVFTAAALYTMLTTGTDPNVAIGPVSNFIQSIQQSGVCRVLGKNEKNFYFGCWNCYNNLIGNSLGDVGRKSRYNDCWK